MAFVPRKKFPETGDVVKNLDAIFVNGGCFEPGHSFFVRGYNENVLEISSVKQIQPVENTVHRYGIYVGEVTITWQQFSRFKQTRKVVR